MSKIDFRALRDHADDFYAADPNASTRDFETYLMSHMPEAASRAGAALSGARQRAGGQGARRPGPAATHATPSTPGETDAERRDRIQRQYRTLARMADRIIDGKLPALIVSGPPGLGKTYTIEKRLEESGKECDIIRGTVSPAGLYIALWGMAEGGVVVLDDCDAVFRDEEALNLLKIVLDSSEKRVVSWRKRAAWLEELDIPDSFEFKGSVVFCTNLDFERETARGSKLAPHYSALMDRSLYLSLGLRTTEDYLERIQQVCIDEGQFAGRGLDETEAEMLMEFIRENAAKFYTLSLRVALQVVACYMMDHENWQDDVRATKMRTM